MPVCRGSGLAGDSRSRGLRLAAHLADSVQGWEASFSLGAPSGSDEHRRPSASRSRHARGPSSLASRPGGDDAQCDPSLPGHLPATAATSKRKRSERSLGSTSTSRCRTQMASHPEGDWMNDLTVGVGKWWSPSLRRGWSQGSGPSSSPGPWPR